MAASENSFDLFNSLANLLSKCLSFHLTISTFSEQGGYPWKRVQEVTHTDENASFQLFQQSNSQVAILKTWTGYDQCHEPYNVTKVGGLPQMHKQWIPGTFSRGLGMRLAVGRHEGFIWVPTAPIIYSSISFSKDDSASMQRPGWIVTAVESFLPLSQTIDHTLHENYTCLCAVYLSQLEPLVLLLHTMHTHTHTHTCTRTHTYTHTHTHTLHTHCIHTHITHLHTSAVTQQTHLHSLTPAHHPTHAYTQCRFRIPPPSPCIHQPDSGHSPRLQPATCLHHGQWWSAHQAFLRMVCTSSFSKDDSASMQRPGWIVTAVESFLPLSQTIDHTLHENYTCLCAVYLSQLEPLVLLLHTMHTHTHTHTCTRTHTYTHTHTHTLHTHCIHTHITHLHTSAVTQQTHLHSLTPAHHPTHAYTQCRFRIPPPSPCIHQPDSGHSPRLQPATCLHHGQWWSAHQVPHHTLWGAPVCMDLQDDRH